MNKLFYTQPASCYYETLLLGNGRLGAALYGGIDSDIYDLNDDTLWSGYPDDSAFIGSDNLRQSRRYCFTESEGYVPNQAELTPELTRELEGKKADVFRRARDYTLADNVEKAQPILEQLYGTYTQSYQPAGRLVIKAQHGEYRDYRRTLALDNALHTANFTSSGGRVEREAFASFPDDVIVVRHACDDGLPETLISLDAQLRHSVYSENGGLILEGEAPGDAIPSYIAIPDAPDYRESPKERGMRYVIALRVRTDGEVSSLGSALRVGGATYLEIYLTVKTSFAGYDRHPYLEGIDYKTAANGILDAALSHSYARLKARHQQDFGELFGRVSLELEGGREDLPTDVRLMEHQKAPDPGMYALMYQFGRYLMISSSRPGSQATNLQGIWNSELFPAWSSNYTLNINTQMNYWGACCANLAECCQPLHELIYKLADTGRRTARELYGADGFCAHHNTDIWGLTYPVGGWATETTQFSYFPLAGAWLTSHLYEYYLETKDKDFLAGKAFDAIVGSARFCDSMLSEQDGELIFCPASSPENGYLKNGKKYAIDKSSAMFQALVREAFEICISACRILGREEELAAHLEERLSKLRGLRIGSDGRLLEWDCERIENDPHHRHLSHLYYLHPMRAVTDERLLSACKASLDFRGDEGTAWGCIWKACFHATLGDGERAIRLIDAMMAYVDARENFADVKSVGDGDDTSDWGEVWSNKSSGTLPNLMCTCPPFQMDGNYGFVAAVNSMLVGEKGGETVLLPAIPALWKSGEVKGLRVGGRTVSVKWENGRIVSSDIV